MTVKKFFKCITLGSVLGILWYFCVTKKGCITQNYFRDWGLD